MLDLFSKLTSHYQKILVQAKAEAQKDGRGQIDIKDLLLALTLEQGSLAAELVNKYQNQTKTSKILETDASPADIEAVNQKAQPKSEELLEILNKGLSPAVKKIIEQSVLIAWRNKHRYIGTEHLLLALISAPEQEINALWQEIELDTKNLKDNLHQALKGAGRFAELTDNLTTEKETDASSNATPALDFFCLDLTNLETQNKIDPVIGRHKEIDRLINILSRRTKNNPLLLGDPGVGKTAIVEGLAKRINHNDVPNWLLDKRILSLDLGLVVAGTMYRGEFEGRLKQILEELKNHPEIILFIDEIHTIVGTGSAPGSLDLANLIKPALAKGLIRCIGATTQEEYKKNIETDAALERRFQVVQIAEPTPTETLAVLQGLKTNYEKFHGVIISDQALEAAVEYSQRYLPEKFFPDKAIDLIDEAASRCKNKKPVPPVLIKIKDLQDKIKKTNQAKETAIAQEDFELAKKHKQTLKILNQNLSKLQTTAKPSAKALPIIGRTQIATTVSFITGVPLTELTNQTKTELSALEKTLNQKLIGQTEAVLAVSKAIKRSRLGLNNPGRPIGSFLFLGPSGVGKTELAKLLTEIVFQDPASLIRLDMSEFGESFNMAKLIGAPAGYVGYKDGNKLTDRVKRRPFSVVLFDEIEKAHPDVFNLLLQIMDEGHLTDAGGKQVNFKNSIIILTSNLGLKELTQQAKLGFTAQDNSHTKQIKQTRLQETKDKLMASVKQFFNPELLNRLDDIIVFNPLSEKDLAKIVKLQIADFNQRLTTQKIPSQIELDLKTSRQIAKLAWSPDQGARGIKRLLQNQLENQLSDLLLKNKLKEKIKLSVVKGQLKLN
ncbi:ATP-dependent Clp protease ATP-binding subunit [Patescibacteria group bacterium]|nr:ATP-dependent Clp protease ATP-binding subunit [Patescibacteria group bacterium]